MVTPREDFFYSYSINMAAKNPKRPHLTHTQLAYLAGFLDADGSIFVRIIPKNDYVLKYQLYFTCNFSQKKKRIYILKYFCRILKIGIVRDRSDNMAELAINGMKNVEWLLRELKPYILIKQRQANLVLRIIEQIPSLNNNPEKFMELCRIADKVCLMNDSKNRQTTSDIVETDFKNRGWL